MIIAVTQSFFKLKPPDFECQQIQTILTDNDDEDNEDNDHEHDDGDDEHGDDDDFDGADGEEKQ